MRGTAIALILVFAFLFSILPRAIVVASTNENSWAILAPMPETGGGINAAAANGKIYAMSGSRNFEYDPELNNWTLKTPMPTPRQWCTIAVYQNKIYTLGGSTGSVEVDGGVASSAVEVYYPSNDTWKVLSPMPTNASNVHANVVNGKIYLIGLSTNLVYDIVRDSWTNKTTMPYPVYSFATGVIDNKIYIIGGLGPTITNRTQIYNPQTDSWSFGTPIPIPVYDTAAGATTGVMAPKRIYVIGGTKGEGGIASEGANLVQVYDPIDNTWTVGEPMPTDRLGLIVAVSDDQLYALYGMRTLVFAPWLKATELYTPFGYGTPDPTYDGTPPKLTVLLPKNETYYQQSVNLEFSVNEPISEMYYKLDNETAVEISTKTTLSNLLIGSHTLTVYAIDEAGNLGSSENVYFTIEPEPFPTALIVASAITVAFVGISLLIYFKKRKH
jgi:N-acetylneuraminic acid mutarotase